MSMSYREAKEVWEELWDQIRMLERFVDNQERKKDIAAKVMLLLMLFLVSVAVASQIKIIPANTILAATAGQLVLWFYCVFRFLVLEYSCRQMRNQIENNKEAARTLSEEFGI